MRVSNSRFIASLDRAWTVDEARQFIKQTKVEFSDATHNVPAFIIGHGSTTVTHSSDDGEPSGTAGRPVLTVLQGSGLGDAVVVVTRYFGGTKLGTGGLVRAYSESVKKVLEVVELAEKVATHTVLLAVPYNLFEQTRLLVDFHRGRILNEKFAADVMIKAQFREERWPDFQGAFTELSHGRLSAEIVESNSATIMPLEGG